MRKFNEFQNENFEKDAMVEEQQMHDAKERPRVERPKHETKERPRVERPNHETKERPRVEGPEQEVKERPRVERPNHDVKERPRGVEEKINFTINFSTDKTQLLELKKVLIELEFNDKEKGKELIKNDERKIRKR